MKTDERSDVPRKAVVGLGFAFFLLLLTMVAHEVVSAMGVDIDWTGIAHLIMRMD